MAGRARTKRTFTAYVEWDPETRLYVGLVPGLPGAHTQAAALDELREKFREIEISPERLRDERRGR